MQKKVRQSGVSAKVPGYLPTRRIQLPLTTDVYTKLPIRKHDTENFQPIFKDPLYRATLPVRRPRSDIRSQHSCLKASRFHQQTCVSCQFDLSLLAERKSTCLSNFNRQIRNPPAPALSHPKPSPCHSPRRNPLHPPTHPESIYLSAASIIAGISAR